MKTAITNTVDTIEAVAAVCEGGDITPSGGLG